MEDKTISSDSRAEGDGTLRSSASVQEEEPLVFGSRMRCPWCKEWRDILSYTTLRQPPEFPKQTTVIYKCSGEAGCKQLFSLKA